MKRIGDNFIQKLEARVPLANKSLLEIGCGDGSRSVELAGQCESLVGIDPDHACITRARERGLKNAIFGLGRAENFPPFVKDSYKFDLALFSLSLHHIERELMKRGIDEAISKVKKRRGRIIFLEPGPTGSLFDAEILFDAWDGDERQAKKDAQEAMKAHQGLYLAAEFWDHNIFRFDSVEDFTDSMKPKKNLDGIDKFLRERNFELRASRRTNIYKLR